MRVIRRLGVSVLIIAALAPVLSGDAAPPALVPPGVTVAGVPVGGMSNEQAQAALRPAFAKPVQLVFTGRHWQLVPARFGAKVGLAQGVAVALNAQPGAAVELKPTVDGAAVRRFVRALDKRVSYPAKDAELAGLKGLQPEFTPEQTGSFQYLARFSTNLGHSWTYAYTDDNQRGALTVNPSSDTTPPAAPANLHRTGSSGTFTSVGWNANSEPDLYRYEVWRSTTSGGPYTKLANVPAGTTEYTDNAVTTGTTYYYVVTAQDTSFNRSSNSNEAAVQAQAQMVAVIFTATVPSQTPPNSTIHIAGSFPDRHNRSNRPLPSPVPAPVGFDRGKIRGL